MTPKRATLAVLVAAVAMTCTVTAQRNIDRLREKAFHQDLLYLPNEKLLNHFTAGLSSVVADLLWLKCIQYTAEEFRGYGKFVWLNHMCKTIVRLDPYFADVYRYGGVLLAALKADDDASITLLKSGIPHCPDKWELPYEIAMVYLLNRREEPGSTMMAGQYLSLAAATGNAPKSIINFAANIQEAHNLHDVERRMWSEMLESEDRFMRNMAARKLEELAIRENCARLTEAVDAFAEQRGRQPRDLGELAAAGFAGALPEDPFGGTYFITSDGNVQNTTLLDQKVERILNHFRNRIDAFKEAFGRWPKSLDEMVEKQIMATVTPHPYPNRAWDYDPQSGDIH